MANLELPMAIFCLSTLSKDPTIFAKASGWVPPREADLKDPKIRDICKVLDAIVYFLPVTKGGAFALSLEAGMDIKIAIAGNDKYHFDPAFGRTPAETVKFIWGKLQSIAASDGTAATDIKELIACLLERQDEKIGTRFRKRKEHCEQFLELARDPDWRSECNPDQIKFLDAAENIFQDTSRFFGFPQAERKVSYDAYVFLMEKARASYQKGAIKPYSWYDLQSKVKNELGLSKRFDLVHYIDKLSTPGVHISRLLQTARSRKLKEIFRLPLEVLEVTTHDASPNTLNQPSNQDIPSFLAHCYGYFAHEDETIVSEVLDSKAKEVLSAIESRSTLDIDGPHCECTLAHHHLSRPDSNPFPYIAISKASSCLTCGLYSAACGKYAEQKGGIRFQTRGCRADVIPLVALPSGGPTPTDLDKFLKGEIMDAMEKIVGSILRTSVDNERKRRLSQSKGSSDGLSRGYSALLDALEQSVDTSKIRS